MTNSSRDWKLIFLSLSSSCIERRTNSGRLFHASGPLIEKGRVPNFRQDLTQIKSPLEADHRLCLDKMEEHAWCDWPRRSKLCGEELIGVHEETELKFWHGLEASAVAGVGAWCAWSRGWRSSMRRAGQTSMAAESFWRIRLKWKLHALVTDEMWLTIVSWYSRRGRPGCGPLYRGHDGTVGLDIH